MVSCTKKGKKTKKKEVCYFSAAFEGEIGVQLGRGREAQREGSDGAPSPQLRSTCTKKVCTWEGVSRLTYSSYH
jgi:hypothetical protein